MKVCPLPPLNRRPPEKCPSQTEAQGKSSAVAASGAKIGTPTWQGVPPLAGPSQAAEEAAPEAEPAARLAQQKINNAAMNNDASSCFGRRQLRIWLKNKRSATAQGRSYESARRMPPKPTESG